MFATAAVVLSLVAGVRHGRAVAGRLGLGTVGHNAMRFDVETAFGEFKPPNYQSRT